MKGSLIKQHRKLQGLTLEELAKGICSVSYLSKIEHNSINASEEIYKLIGNRLNIKLNDINQDFDEELYENLLEWHQSIQWRDLELMKDFHNKCTESIKLNKNVELNNLYKVILSRHQLKLNDDVVPDEVIRELQSIYPTSTDLYKYLFHKALGIQMILQNEFHKALSHFKQAHTLLKKVPYDDAETYFHLCLAYTKLNASVESVFYGEKALERFVKDLDYKRIIDTYMLIAINYRYMNIFDLAQQYFEKLLKIGREHLTQNDFRKIYHNLGNIHVEQENYEKGLQFLRKAKEITTSERSFEVSTVYLLALSCFKYGDIDSCWKYIEEGEALASEYNDLYYLHSFYVFKNEISGKTMDDEFIREFERRVIPDIKKLHMYERYHNWLIMLGDIYYEKRMYKKAAMNYKEANKYKYTQKKDLI